MRNAARLLVRGSRVGSDAGAHWISPVRSMPFSPTPVFTPPPATSSTRRFIT